MTVIVHLIGFPGVGKFTIPKEIARLAATPDTAPFAVMDNHRSADVVLGAIDVDGPGGMPRPVWARVDEVREVLYRTIEELSPPSWSFTFTNVLTAQELGDRAIVDRLALLAQRRRLRSSPSGSPATPTNCSSAPSAPIDSNVTSGAIPTPSPPSSSNEACSSSRITPSSTSM